jgi:hypothetical protein
MSRRTLHGESIRNSRDGYFCSSCLVEWSATARQDGAYLVMSGNGLEGLLVDDLGFLVSCKGCYIYALPCPGILKRSLNRT